MSEKEIYYLLGKFIVQFEELNHYSIACIRTILLREGLKNENVQEILLAKQSAETLRDTLYSLCGEIFQPDNYEKKILSKLFDEYQKIIELRNDLLHSSWAVISTNNGAEYLPVGVREKLHRNKYGCATKRDFYNEIELNEEIKKVSNCVNKFAKLLKCLSENNKLRAYFNFINKQLATKTHNN